MSSSNDNNPSEPSSCIAKTIKNHYSDTANLPNDVLSDYEPEHRPYFQDPTTYSVLENDSRGIPLTIAQHVSHDVAGAFMLEGKALARSRTVVRDRRFKRQTLRHPARTFVDLAMCHKCGHAASKHSNNETGCAECQRITALAGGMTLGGKPVEGHCERLREIVLLDGLADFAAEGISLERALTEPGYAARLFIEPDPSKLGWRLTLIPERDSA